MRVLTSSGPSCLHVSFSLSSTLSRVPSACLMRILLPQESAGHRHLTRSFRREVEMSVRGRSGERPTRQHATTIRFRESGTRDDGK